MDVQPTNLQQLHVAIMSIWTKISEECFQHLVESMPRRRVLKANGGPTQYWQGVTNKEAIECTKRHTNIQLCHTMPPKFTCGLRIIVITFVIICNVKTYDFGKVREHRSSRPAHSSVIKSPLTRTKSDSNHIWRWFEMQYKADFYKRISVLRLWPLPATHPRLLSPLFHRSRPLWSPNCQNWTMY